MKSMDVLPTPDNLVDFYLKDSVGRNQDLNAFVNILDDIDDACSISIDGQWGSGKTFYIKQAKMIIDSMNQQSGFYEKEEAKKIRLVWGKCNPQKKEIQPMITAYYDAWLHDNEDDPILSLVYEIMKENKENISVDNQKNWGEILASIADEISGRSVSNILKTFKGKDLFEKQKEEATVYSIVQDFFASLLPERGNRLVVFIDELDRCSPVYAIKLLERIKHYFLYDNVIFVFSLNAKELQHTIQKCYGDEFNACRYLDRFFDIRIEMPPADLKKFYFNLGLSSQSNMREVACLEIISQMDMSLREISRFLKMSRYAAYKYTDGDKSEKERFLTRDDGTSKLIGLCIIVPILLGLKITDGDGFENFIEGKDGSWLRKIILSERLGSLITGCLLEENEAYTNIEGKNLVEKNSKIDAVYEAIFVKDYESTRDYMTKIGKAVFEQELKKEILKAISFTSKYTELS